MRTTAVVVIASVGKVEPRISIERITSVHQCGLEMHLCGAYFKMMTRGC